MSFFITDLSEYKIQRKIFPSCQFCQDIHARTFQRLCDYSTCTIHFTLCKIRNVVSFKFVGCAPGSTDIRHTIARFCNELSRFLGLEPTELPSEFKDLKAHFKDVVIPKAVQAAREQKKKILFVIDALNQFGSDSYNAVHLDWLPSLEQHGPDLKIIVSTLKVLLLGYFSRKFNVNCRELGWII